MSSLKSMKRDLNHEGVRFEHFLQRIDIQPILKNFSFRLSDTIFHNFLLFTFTAFINDSARLSTKQN